MYLSDILFLNISTGFIVLVMIILANVYQRRVMKRFSGVIGKVMSWYSLGLFTFLILTIWGWVSNVFDMSLWVGELVGRLLFIVAIAFFVKGARVIR
jgi:hypothetical protein